MRQPVAFRGISVQFPERGRASLLLAHCLLHALEARHGDLRFGLEQ